MKLLMALAASALGYCYYRGCEVNAQAAKKGAIKEDLNRWEAEGGNVPSVATPSPAPVPPSSFPNSDPLVH